MRSVIAARFYGGVSGASRGGRALRAAGSYSRNRDDRPATDRVGRTNQARRRPGAPARPAPRPRGRPGLGPRRGGSGRLGRGRPALHGGARAVPRRRPVVALVRGPPVRRRRGGTARHGPDRVRELHLRRRRPRARCSSFRGWWSAAATGWRGSPSSRTPTACTRSGRCARPAPCATPTGSCRWRATGRRWPRPCAGCGRASWTRWCSRTTCSPSPTPPSTPATCWPGWPRATRRAGRTRWTGWSAPRRSC